MNEQDMRTETALFRYGVIAPLVCRRGDEQQMRGLRQEILLTLYTHPDGSMRRIPERTLRHWLRRYRKQGFEGLFDDRRSDRGKSRAIPNAVLKRAEELRREEPSRGIPKIISILQKEGYQADVLAERTLGRQLVRLGATKERLKKGAGSYQRWEQLYANDLWQGDVSHGIWLRDPYNPNKPKKTKLIVFMDDATRVCTHAEFYFDEQLPSLMDCFGKALLKRGRPCRMLFDNGSIYRSTTLATVAAELGIELSFCRPRAPQGKGKVERLIRTIQEGFFKEASCAGIDTLDELNKLFQGWLRTEYHDREHGELHGLTPIQRWEKDSKRLSLVTIDELRKALMLRAKRRVHINTALVSVDERAYQCSSELAGQEVEVRWNPNFINSVDIWCFGEFVETAHEFQISTSTTNKPVMCTEPAPGVPRASSKNYFQNFSSHPEDAAVATFKTDELLSQTDFVALFEQICRPLEQPESDLLVQFFAQHAPMYKSLVVASLSRAVNVKGSELHIRFYAEQLQQALVRR